MQENISQIEQNGVSVIAISPLTALQSNELYESLHLAFTLATDYKNAVAEEFGIAFALPEPLITVYNANGIDLSTINNDGSCTLPIPATYIIDQSGLIRHAYINTDYTKRLDPKEIITALHLLT